MNEIALLQVGVLVFHCTTGTLPFARLGDSLEVDYCRYCKYY